MIYMSAMLIVPNVRIMIAMAFVTDMLAMIVSHLVLAMFVPLHIRSSILVMINMPLMIVLMSVVRVHLVFIHNWRDAYPKITVKGCPSLIDTLFY